MLLSMLLIMLMRALRCVAYLLAYVALRVDGSARLQAARCGSRLLAAHILIFRVVVSAAPRRLMMPLLLLLLDVVVLGEAGDFVGRMAD